MTLYIASLLSIFIKEHEKHFIFYPFDEFKLEIVNLRIYLYLACRKWKRICRAGAVGDLVEAKYPKDKYRWRICKAMIISFKFQNKADLYLHDTRKIDIVRKTWIKRIIKYVYTEFDNLLDVSLQSIITEQSSGGAQKIILNHSSH